MPYLGGAYGGYIGMTGNWAYWLGCKGGFIAFSATNAAQAHTNFTQYDKGVGDGSYWFMGGPGVDPHYNGTTTEASAWGAAQAARALSDIANGALRLQGRLDGRRTAGHQARGRTTAGTTSTPRRAAE